MARRDPDTETDAPWVWVRVRRPGRVLRLVAAALVFAAATIVIITAPDVNAPRDTPIADAIPSEVRSWLLRYVLVVLGPTVFLLILFTAVAAFRLALTVDLVITAIVTALITLGLNEIVDWEAAYGITVLVACATIATTHFGKVGRIVLWTWVIVTVGLYGILRTPGWANAIGELALGAFCAYLLQLVLGIRQKVTTPTGVARSLDDIGLGPVEVVWFETGATRSRTFLAVPEVAAQLFLKVTSLRDLDVDLVNKLRRRVTLRLTATDEVFTSPKLQTNHELAMVRLARGAGARVPPVVAATVTESGESVLASLHVDGMQLSSLAEIHDDVLLDVWEQVRGMHDRRFAHKQLRADNVIVDFDGRPWIVDLATATYGASDQLLAQDVAELLASLAVRVGPERSVATAAKVLDRESLHAALPLLLLEGLSPTTRRELKRAGTLGDLRQDLADEVDGDVSEQARVTRVQLKTLIPVLGLGVAMYILLPQLADFQNTIEAWRDANWPLLVGAALASLATYVAVSLQIVGSVPGSISFWWSLLVPIAAEFANRVTPAGVGGMAVIGNYVRKAGYTRAEATTAVTLQMTSTFLASALIVVILLIAAGSATTVTDEFQAPEVSPWLVAGVVALVVAGAAVSLSLRRIRDPILRWARDGYAALRSVIGQPARAATLFAGGFGNLIAYTACFLLCLYAFPNVSISPATAAVIYVIGQALGQLVPTPGGVGGVEAVLITALTRAGVDSGAAVAAVLTFRLLTYWLPTIPSVPAFKVLQAAGKL